MIVNREQWLSTAAEHLSEWLGQIGEEVPPMRISVGFPGGRSNRKTTVGQCWPTSLTDDGVAQIFISPIRGEKDTPKILGTLLHEMIHAVDDCENGHKGNFVRIAKAVGFVSKWTSSDNQSEELHDRLVELAETLGPIPHATLLQGGRAADEPKKQTTRMIKVICPDDGYTVRMTRKWLDQLGTPTCPCGDTMEEA